MPAPSALTEFAESLRNEITLDASIEGAEAMLSEVFTSRLIDVLVDAGELEEAVPCYLRERGIEVHGYGIDDDDTLNLVSTIYRGHSSSRQRHADRGRDGVPSARGILGTGAKRWAYTMDSRNRPTRETWPCAFIRRRELSDASSYSLSRTGSPRSSTSSQRTSMVSRFAGRSGTSRGSTVWKAAGSRRSRSRSILLRTSAAPLPCLSAGTGHEDYSAFLAVVPGRVLADIYDAYGARLLELNVRSFLQAKGKINRGIRDTLADEPTRFLAYNNGISATASRVEVVELPDGGVGITRIVDLQIVNGGQTTASIHRAMRTKVDLSDVSVQAKITVIDPVARRRDRAAHLALREFAEQGQRGGPDCQ